MTTFLPGQASRSELVTVCYSSDFIRENDTWVYLHFIDGFILELFLDDWKLSFILTFFYEAFETSLLTLFGNYVFFGTTANQEYESASGLILNDLTVNLMGILLLTWLRRGLGVPLPPLWDRLHGWLEWTRSLVQLLTLFVAGGLLLAVIQSRLPFPAPVGGPEWGAIGNTGLYLLWLAWIAILQQVNQRWAARIWKRQQPLTWPWMLLAGVIVGAGAPFWFALPYSVPTTWAYWVTALVVTLIFLGSPASTRGRRRRRRRHPLAAP